MRLIPLKDNDALLFDEEMLPVDCEFLSRHKDTFCRMWSEQGRTFWRQYVEVFRSYILHESLLGDLPCDIFHLEHALDHAFKVIEKHFVEGKANQAKQLLYQIADLGRNRHKFGYLDSKSVSKDPFYTKDTRDLFRDFFGQATEKSSYIRAYLLTPVYMRFGGSMVRTLVNWKDAKEIDANDVSYYTAPRSIERKSSPAEVDTSVCLCSTHLQDCNMKFYQQFVMGSSSTPVSLDLWTGGDPRFEVPGNPLYDIAACDKSDWREALTIEQFQEFYSWCSSFDKPENQCAECRTRRKARKKKNKKKKKASEDDSSLVADSSVSSDKNPGHRCHPEPCCQEGAKQAGFESRPKAELIDASIAKDVSKQVRKKSQQNYPQLQVSTGPPDLTMSRATDITAATLAAVAEQKWCEEQHEYTCPCSICRYMRDHSDVDTDGSSGVDPPPPITPGDWKSEKLSFESPAKSATEKLTGESDKPTGNALTNAPALSKEMAEQWERLQARKSFFFRRSVITKHNEMLDVISPRWCNVKAHFIVWKKLEDGPDGATEVRIVFTKVELEPAEGKSMSDIENKLPKLRDARMSQLTPDKLFQHFGFPPDALWAEDSGSCAVEVDYLGPGQVERSIPFILKVSSHPAKPNLSLAKELLFKLLNYVTLRKNRPSAGWLMSEEDVVMFCHSLEERTWLYEGVTVTISTCGLMRPLSPNSQIAVAPPPEPKEVIPKCIDCQLKNSEIVYQDGKFVHSSGKPKEQQKHICSEAKPAKKHPDSDKKHSDGDPAPPPLDVAEALSLIRDGIEGESLKSKKKKKKAKAAADAAATSTSVAVPTQPTRTAADNKALANASTRQELVSILGDLAREGKVDSTLPENLQSVAASAATNPTIPPEIQALSRGDGDAAIQILREQGRAQTAALALASGGDRRKSICSYCEVLEPAQRTFKKCAKCKEDKVTNARYYCCKQCQIADWELKHFLEHQHNLFMPTHMMKMN